MLVTRLDIPLTTLGDALLVPDARRELREEITPAIREINERIREGWRVTGLDYVIWTEGEGLQIVVMMEKPAEPGGSEG
jgi:hypothetical protein